MKPIHGVIANAERRFEFLFAPYAVKLYFDEKRHVRLAHGSTNFMSHLPYYIPRQCPDEMAEIGPMSELDGDSVVMLGGDHPNELVFNNSLSAFKAHRQLLMDGKEDFFCNRMKRKTVIGGNVTISRDVMVLPGAHIGEGAVIAAGAVVSGEIPPFAIAGGTPAKVIRMRFDEAGIAAMQKIRWWEWDVQFLWEHLKLLNTDDPVGLMKKLPPLESIPKQKKDQALCFKNSANPNNRQGMKITFMGAEKDGRFIPAKSLPEQFQGYVSQTGAPPEAEILYLSDIFERFGV